jgi:pSer/pThr/pTyr-binding forkhead associated (FHA) protein
MSEDLKAAFLADCGATTPLRIDVKMPGERAIASHELHQPYAVLGRHARADLRLESKQIGRRHAYLQVIGGRVFCLDLHSRNGTHWKDGPQTSGWLRTRDLMRIGPFWWWVVDAGPAEGPLPDWSPAASGSLNWHHLPSASLEFVNGQTKTECWPVDRVITLIGCAQGCKIRLHGREVAPVHCSLVSTPGGVWALDLVTSTGVRVNGWPTRLARLKEGDLLQIGEFMIRLRYEEAPCPKVPADNGTALVREGVEVNGQGAVVAPVEVPLDPASPQQIVLPVPSSNGWNTDAAPPEHLLWPLLQSFGLSDGQPPDQLSPQVLAMMQMLGTLHQQRVGLIREEVNELCRLAEELKTLKGSMPAAAADGSPGKKGEPSPRDRDTPRPSPKPATMQMPSLSQRPDVHTWLSDRIAAVARERQSRWQKIMGLLWGRSDSGASG